MANMATIYFSGSISGGRSDVALYRRFISALQRAGHRVLAGAVASEEIGDYGETITPREIHDRDLRWVDDADVIVAEVSMPSHGVGYEIAYARHRRDIPVICLYRQGHTQRCSAMLAGSPGVELIEYDDPAEAELRLVESLGRLGR